MDLAHPSLPGPDDLVLVAIIPGPQDLEIARILGWYRIPLRSAPKVVAVDFLAFYQPGSFGKYHRWRVEKIAPVIGHELTTRAALLNQELDHPRAGEEYFKIQLGPMVSLPDPIRANGWRRFTFLYTTGAYLLAADTLQDLVIRSEERKLLWRTLRERALQTQRYGAQTLKPVEDLNPELLAELLGVLVPPDASESTQRRNLACSTHSADPTVK